MNTNPSEKKIPIGISSCLLGQEVRFDSGHKHNSYITGTLSQYFEFKAFCPEVYIGLGIPREPIRLIEENDKIQCVGTKTPDLNFTEQLTASADEQKHWHAKIFGYILKKDSPSCGMERVKVYKNNQPQRSGQGLYARQLMKNFPNLPVEEEGRLGDPILRENFIKRVFIYERWRELYQTDLSIASLTRFHARHKLILMSHDQDKARELGRKLSEIKSDAIASFALEYEASLMSLLKIKATRKNNVNVLQHIQGYLKNFLDKEDKRELTEVIEQYRLGFLPLIVPITLLKHHFMKHPNDYIGDSYFINPHPKELMLLNAL
jgi:uncharacterized protein YbgA (DUF1722 family)/uncharacterized protein YbbK (DUF523 family)